MNLEISSLSAADNDFEWKLQQLLIRGAEFDPTVDARVAEIVEQVRTYGDQALIDLTEKYDRYQVSSAREFEVNMEEAKRATARLSSELLDAIEVAAKRVESYHRRQMRDETWSFSENGSKFGQIATAISRVGLYVPGGTASYLSTVLMTCIPAKVAGVKEVILVVPAPQGVVRDSVLAAAYIAKVDRIFTIGGAQAIAALAFGTESVPKVDKIVGPGNAWVSAAKRHVFGRVGVDMIAGPSEVVIACDDSTNAEWAAMDMFAQAEHDRDAQSILISTSQSKLDEVRMVMATELPKLERSEIICNALAKQGALISVENHEQMVDVINRIAPEHLILMCENPSAVKNIEHAGAIFLGQYSTEVLGDYCAGPSHVLPTSGAARFSSPLGVYDFIKRSSLIECSVEDANQLAHIASVLAREEGLTAHARAAECRQK